MIKNRAVREGVSGERFRQPLGDGILLSEVRLLLLLEGLTR